MDPLPVEGLRQPVTATDRHQFIKPSGPRLWEVLVIAALVSTLAYMVVPRIS